jgi:hypothetical protein
MPIEKSRWQGDAASVEIASFRSHPDGFGAVLKKESDWRKTAFDVGFAGSWYPLVIVGWNKVYEVLTQQKVVDMLRYAVY